MKTLIVIFLVGFLFVACSSSTDDETQNNTSINNSSENNSLLAQTYTKDEGRFLVAQCAACHGTNGYSTTSWDSIAGEGEFATDTFHGIMGAQTHAYSAEQKQAIDNYLNSLSEDEEDDENEEEDDD